MDFIGLWKVHSLASYTEDGMVFMPVEEYLNAPMPAYISDPESIEAEMADRRKNASAMLKICGDGMIYNLMPIPEGVPQEEIDSAVEAGCVKLVDGMVAGQAMPWEIRDGELWYNTGDEIEIMGEAKEPRLKASCEDGIITIMSIKFIKA